MGLGSENPGFLKLEGLFGRGALKGKAGRIVESATKAGIDPNLFAAVIAHETGFGTSDAVKNKNNPGGIMDWDNKYKTLRSFKNIDDGIEYSAKNLGRRVKEVGGNLESLASVYAPINAENDPKGLNSNWYRGVSGILAGLAK